MNSTATITQTPLTDRLSKLAAENRGTLTRRLLDARLREVQASVRVPVAA